MLYFLPRSFFRDQFNDAHDAQFQKVTATKVYCLRCPKNVDITEDNDKPIILEKISDGGVVISNANLELIFDEDTHLLATVTDKRTGLTKEVKMVFGGYPTIQFRNGAYLFKPDTSYKPDVLPIIDPIDNLKEIVIISGPVFSEISLIYEAGVSASNQASFVHTMRLYHTQPDSPLSQGIYIENNFNFADQNNFRDVDMFMRLQSGLKNRGNTWYSDSSGLSMQKRTPAVNASGLEGNTYPITSTIYLEDSEARLTLLVDHATGASSQRQVLHSNASSLNRVLISKYVATE
jgi:alpha-mannosidase II